MLVSNAEQVPCCARILSLAVCVAKRLAMVYHGCGLRPLQPSPPRGPHRLVGPVFSVA
jgi:hypothetical protein